MCKDMGYANYDFNISGDMARKALREHYAQHGSFWAKAVARIVRFFI
jgi:hypothetical protein